MKLFLTLFVIICFVGNIKSQIYVKYADGNGNQYVITNDSIEYIPVTPEMSSSGFYSGGTPQKCSITKNDFSVIEKDINRIVDNPNIHIAKRIKGTGMISIYQNEKIEKEIFVDNSDELIDFEKNLKYFLNKKADK